MPVVVQVGDNVLEIHARELNMSPVDYPVDFLSVPYFVLLDRACFQSQNHVQYSSQGVLLLIS